MSQSEPVQIFSQKIPGLDPSLCVYVIRGEGEAVDYVIGYCSGEEGGSFERFADFCLPSGLGDCAPPRCLTPEALVAILIDWMETSLKAEEHWSPFLMDALSYVRAAKALLEADTRDRERKNVGCEVSVQ